MRGAMLAVLAAMALSAPLAAQTIDNVAAARWNERGIERQLVSNRVSLAIVAERAAITTYRIAPDGPQSLTYSADPCIPGVPVGPRTTTVAPASTYRIGEEILVAVAASFANRDPAAIDRIALDVTTSRGERKMLSLPESGPDSGRFIGYLATVRAMGSSVAADCQLGVASGDIIAFAPRGGSEQVASLRAEVTMLADPFGVVFDSETGAPISGARITLRDAATGQPAQVFGEDGVTPWPASVVSGAPIIDGTGKSWPMEPGRYWFPLAALGRYRLEIEPPAPFSAPSAASRAQLDRLARGDGRAFALSDGSFGAPFALASAVPVEIDIPLDAPGSPIALSQNVSRPVASPGDVLIVTLTATNPDPTRPRGDMRITEQLPRDLRLRPESILIDGISAPEAVVIAPDGLSFVITREAIPAGQSMSITYAASVRADARAGQAEVRADAVDGLGRSARANAVVRIARDTIAGRMTIIGRVVAGDCRNVATAPGLAGARVMMEDGSFAVTDAEGRYRFEGVVPGTHVVQLARASLSKGAHVAACDASTRSAGDAASRFVVGQGGSMARADFHVIGGAEPRIAAADVTGVDEMQLRPLTPPAAPTIAPDPAVTDWLALGDGPDGWLAPAEDHNPRAPAVKVAFRHRPGHTIRLLVDGQPVDETAFDGTQKSPGGRFAVSQWRGIPLLTERTVLTAETLDAAGTVTVRQERIVHFTSQPARVELVAAQSLLVADGVTRPVVTVRITDRNGRPVREGLAGDFVLSAPYESAAQIELQQIRQLSGVGEATARWVIEGNEGLARIELAPTMVSGRLRIAFTFSQDNIRRRQEVEAWVTPGDIPWTLVGLGEATLGARSVADNMETGGTFNSDLGNNARVALYAKGRVLGKYLLTLAYDSARQRDDQPLVGAIDPAAYYTVFGDSSQRRFDAATREKLYVRVESAAFRALYGDFQTGFDATTLGRYQRTATGLSAEAQLGDVRVQAFGAEIGSNFRRDEFQGKGISGPYPLGSRDIVINSERVTIEVRDRFRSEVVVSARSLTRFIDYTIDVLSGTITFSEPMLARDDDLNPRIVIIEYEAGQTQGGELNAGVRADWSSDDGKLRVGATAITDKGDATRTNLGAADVRLQLGQGTELRGEIGLSQHGSGEQGTAWLAEVQHQTGKLDVIAYARSLDSDYGVAQQSLAETGRRKLGVDARYQLDDRFSVTLSALQDAALDNGARRRGGQAQLAWRSPTTNVRFGFARFEDRLANGETGTSNVIETGLTQRLFDNALEISAASSLALGRAGSVDLPSRHQFGLRYAVMRDVRLTGIYEIAEGAELAARTLRGGIEVTPWQGGRVVSSLGRSSTGAAVGGSTFAGFGAAQTIDVSPALSLTATLDGNRVLGAVPSAGAVINPGQPVANGGPLSVDRTLFEDFTAVTLGGTWRAGRWTANGRGEYRAGALADRYGLTLGVIRQIGEGRSLGSNLVWTRALVPGGASSAVIDAGVTFAYRPDGSDFALLARAEYRADAVTGAVAGQTGPVGRTALDVTGDALSRRLVGSISANWSPRGRARGRQLSEVGLFLGTRYGFDRLAGLDLAGLALLAGLDARIGLNEWLDVGGSASIRANLTDGSLAYSIGPQASLVVAEGTLLSLGYNIAGFRDPDFAAARALDEGLFAAIRFKFDAGLLGLDGPNAAGARMVEGAP